MDWFERKFSFDLPLWMKDNVVERLRGTPARVEERMQGLSAHQLVQQRNGKWSIQEEVGHLLDLEPLWLGRVDDILGGAEEMRVADLENQKTHRANHNTRPLIFLLSALRTQRLALIERVETLPQEAFGLTSRHPRLKQPMRMIDLLFFTAEHDDHHLAVISRLIGQAAMQDT
ncbi:MAG: DinB family protein [Bacteroidota bacterium]